MSDTRYPTRMHEVLGVETGERFKIEKVPDEFFLNHEGRMTVVTAGRMFNSSGDILTYAINNGIIRKPRRREQEEREMTPEERLPRKIFTKSEQDEMPGNYPATHLDKADYAQFCLHKSLASISPALGRISRLCGLLRLGEKDGKNTTPRIITHDGSRMALKHLTMVKRDVDDAYQEILSIFESTKEPGAVSEAESVGQGPEPGMRKEAGKDEAY